MTVEEVVAPVVAEVEAVAVTCEAPVCESTMTAPSTTVDADLAARLLKQVEFYFSDANLPRDRFLQEEVKKEEGWVALETICSFSRMKKLYGSEQVDVAVVAEALKASKELLEVSEDSLKVRRRVELPEEPLDSIRTTVFVRNFPETVTLEDLEAFFTGVSEQVAAIRLRRHPKTKSFRGSVFLQLKTEEEADRLAALKTLTFTEGVTLDVLSMLAHMEEQNAEKMKRESKSTSETETSSELKIEDVKGHLLHVSGLPAGAFYKIVRSAFATKAPVAFAESTQEEGCMLIRFKEAVATSVCEELTAAGGLDIPEIGKISVMRVATDAEEETFFVKAKEAMQANAAGSKFGGNKRYSNNGQRGRRNFGKRPRVD